MYRNWKPNKQAKIEFANKMKEIENFCKEKNIQTSLSNDSYYFEINKQKYRVSNHTIESSNKYAYNDFGEQIREKYHEDKRKEDVIYIHANKTRIIDIYNNILKGFKLDGKGFIKK